MFLFSKVKVFSILFVLNIFMFGVAVGDALHNGLGGLWVVPFQLLGAGLAFRALASKISRDVAHTSEIICTREQARLIVSLHDKGLILDPDFEPVARLSRELLDDMEKVGVYGR